MFSSLPSAFPYFSSPGPFSLDYFLSYCLFYAVIYLVSVIFFCLPIFPRSMSRCLPASRVMGIFHSVLLCYTALPYFLSLAPFLQYTIPNTITEIRLMEWSGAYFLMDFFHFLFKENGDFPLLLHHLVALLFTGSVIQQGAGGASFLIAALFGEITNPLQSLWFITKQANFTVLHDFLSPPFTFIFVLVRCLALPPFVVAILVDYYHGAVERSDIPLTAAILWGFLSSSMTIGGFVWSMKLAAGLRKKWKKQKSNKMK